MRIKISCDFCDKEIERYPSQVKKNNFCSRKCLGNFASKTKNPEGYKYRDFSKNSKRMTDMNKELNPNRMDIITRTKLRQSRLGKGTGKSYAKIFGKHVHREVAEKKIGRKLKPGEVVHHLDSNQRNNSPENLMVFPSQKEHLEWHRENDTRYRRGGGAL